MYFDFNPGDPDLIENYKKSITGISSCGQDLYRVTYDEIREPKLAKLIKIFIKEGKPELLDFLYSDEILPDDYAKYEKDTINSIQNHRRIMMEYLDGYDGSDIRKLGTVQEHLDDCKKINSDYIDNKALGLVHQQVYKDEILKLITLNEIASVSRRSYEMVKKFNNAGSKKD